MLNKFIHIETLNLRGRIRQIGDFEGVLPPNIKKFVRRAETKYLEAEKISKLVKDSEIESLVFTNLIID
jgi:hypothetical protein